MQKPQQPTTAPQEKERIAAKELAAGHFRKARDLYKELCKIDRPRFLGLLVEANQGLVSQMIQKGQYSEAVQVRNYLKTIAPAGALFGMDLDLALKIQDWPEALRAALGLWSLPAGAKNGGRIADAIVLCCPTEEEMASFPAPLAQEAALIFGALQDAGESRFDAVALKLRPLGASSIFASWKTFLKGMAAFHSDQMGKAQTLFKMLPEESLAARAARAYAFFIAGEEALEGASASAQTQLLHGGLRLLGQTTYEAALGRAQECWKAGKLSDSYRELRAVAAFPSLDGGLAGALSDFYFKGCFSLGWASRELFIRHMEDLLLSAPVKGDQEACSLARMLLTASLSGYNGSHPRFFLEKFEKHYKGTTPALGELLSLGYYRITQCLMGDEELYRKDEVEDIHLEQLREHAMELLEKSIETNPGHLAAHLAHASLSRSLFDRRRQVHLLDALCKRFPKEKAVFLLAGTVHLEADRPDYALAASYLDTALGLDPFDTEALQKQAHARVQAAVKAYTAGQLAEGRLHFGMIALHHSRQGGSFALSEEYTQVRQGVLETLFGDPKQGRTLLEQGFCNSGSVPALLLFQHACQVLWAKKQDPKKPLLKRLQEQPPQSAAERASLLAMLLHVREWGSASQRAAWTAEHEAVGKCLLPLAGDAFSETECATLLPQLAEVFLLLPLAKAIAKTGVKRAPGRVFFQAAHYTLTTKHHRESQRAKLEIYRESSLSDGDKEALKFITSQLERLTKFYTFDDAWEEVKPARRSPAKKKKPSCAKAKKPASPEKPKKPEKQAPGPFPIQIELF